MPLSASHAIESRCTSLGTSNPLSLFAYGRAAAGKGRRAGAPVQCSASRAAAANSAHLGDARELAEHSLLEARVRQDGCDGGVRGEAVRGRPGASCCGVDAHHCDEGVVQRVAVDEDGGADEGRLRAEAAAGAGEGGRVARHVRHIAKETPPLVSHLREEVLELLWCHVLALRELEERLLAVDDAQAAALIPDCYVARVDPPAQQRG